MDDSNIEQGKIMQLYGLSAAQWNGCIVDVGKRTESDATRYSCEVILGENKGKVLAVRSDNLMDIPALTAEEHACAVTKYDYFNQTFEAGTTNVDELLIIANEVITVVPNDCSIWHIIADFCKFYVIVL